MRAADGVSLTIEAGEFVAMINQSGSGKSTLMNVLAALDNPSSGQFLIDGQDVSAFGPDELAQLRRERFGFIFQRYHLLPHLMRAGNAALPSVYAGLPDAERQQRAESLLTRLGLQERMHHRPNELSGGQQQRVSIARALMNGSQIILADRAHRRARLRLRRRAAGPAQGAERGRPHHHPGHARCPRRRPCAPRHRAA